MKVVEALVPSAWAGLVLASKAADTAASTTSAIGCYEVLAEASHGLRVAQDDEFSKLGHHRLSFALDAGSARFDDFLMIVQNLAAQIPFTTKDGSTIRSILDATNAPVQNQSLAEATLPANAATQRHYHKLSEEIYFILEGSGEMTIDDETRAVAHGDAILIPPNAWHTIRAATDLRFLCCCAPVYSHNDTYFD